MSKWEALLAIHNFSELKSLAYNAKIRTSLKFYLYGNSFYLHSGFLFGSTFRDFDKPFMII